MNLRIGIGVDAHRRVNGRTLVLGGVTIPSAFGLEAHSDGDVICHAIIEALLGAANMGDKGRLFPPTDEQYKGIRSTVLLERTWSAVSRAHHVLVNVDVSVMCEEPRIAPHTDQMKQELASAMKASPEQISIKGTTLEHMGFTGRREGIAAMAVVLLTREQS
jgi:2-C-methyl-D-erythritol 2,4-cyclodiphosphate synthase